MSTPIKLQSPATAAEADEAAPERPALQAAEDPRVLHVVVLGSGGAGEGYDRIAHWTMDAEAPRLIEAFTSNELLGRAQVSKLYKHLHRLQEAGSAGAGS